MITDTLTRRTVPLQLGTRSLDVIVEEADEEGLTYVCLHEDEKTAVKAVRALLPRSGGRLVRLSHIGERNISFSLPGLGRQRYIFDPNRVFTDAGVEASLAGLGATSPEARHVARSFARALLDVIGPTRGRPLVAVHNNLGAAFTEKSYSIRRYAHTGDLASAALSVHMEESVDPDDFFFVTDYAVYQDLARGGFNVVLQDNARAADDGSLSVYCGQRGITYVNVEACRGHYAYQVRMLNFLSEVLQRQVV